MATASPRRHRRASAASSDDTCSTGHPGTSEYPQRRGEVSAVHGALQQVEDLIGRCVGQTLALTLQGFVEVDGNVLHLLVRLLGAADENDVIRLGEAPVAVLAVEADAQKADDLLLVALD